jgi:hypothetical protein
MDGWNDQDEGVGGGLNVLGLPEVKARIHRKLLGRLNLGNLEAVSREEATRAIKQAIREILATERESSSRRRSSTRSSASGRSNPS